MLLRCYRLMDYKRALQLFDELLDKEDDLDEDGHYDSVLTRLAPKHSILAYKAQIYLKSFFCAVRDCLSLVSEGKKYHCIFEWAKSKITALCV